MQPKRLLLGFTETFPAFLPSKAFFPVFFGSRYDTAPISFVFLSSFLLICFGTSARGDWSFPLWPAGFCIPHSLVRQGECELELEMFSFKVLF